MQLSEIYSSAKRSLGMVMKRVGSRLLQSDTNDMNATWCEMDPIDRYNAMWAYYKSNSLYEFLNEFARQKRLKNFTAKPLRNPTHRVVEFHATHLWPGTLPHAMPLNPEFAYSEEIAQIWEWSNWSQRKQVAARWFACLGDMYLKVATKTEIDHDATAENYAYWIDQGATDEQLASLTPVLKVVRVYLQLIDPRFVTKQEKDERGFFTSIRLDIPEGKDEKNGNENWRTEFWDKGSYRIYAHQKGPNTKEHELEKNLVASGGLGEILPGMNFVPFTHAKFLDSGDDRGWPATWASIEKIDEANRQATRLSELIFRHNKALWAALSNRIGRNGEPLPPPTFRDPTTGTAPQWQDGDIVELPGMTELKSIAPDIDYKAALEVLNAMLAEIEQDLPELRYNNLQSQSNLAADTVAKFMAPALARLAEARANAEAALIQAQSMALTIGAAAGLFEKIPEGAYENGKLVHTFLDRPFLAQTSADAAEVAEKWRKSGLPLKAALREAGWGEDKIKVAMDELAEEKKEQAASLAKSLILSRENFEGGSQSGLPIGEDDE